MNLGFLNDDSTFLKPTPWPQLKKRINRLLERNARFVAKVERQRLRSVVKAKSERLTSTNNSKDIPISATIRQERIKCGKEDCLAEHGSYYYAY